jgi:potassium/sodium efflux P-type ATPase
MPNKKIEEIFKEYNTGKDGLSSEEAEKRLKKYGENKIETKKKTPWWMHFIKEFTDLMVIILIIAVIIAGFAGEWKDATVILFIVFLNAIIGFIQKYKAEKAIEALKKMVAPHARVVRNGKEQQIDAKELVPGDIIILQEGDRVTADARLIEESELETQEAPLTGESMPVNKTVGDDDEEDEDEKEMKGENSEKSNRHFVYMGTDVVHGSGRAVVVNTGMDTKFGQIADLTTTTKKDKSPLQKELHRIGVFVGKITFVISAILIAIGYFIQNEPFVETFLFAASVAVAAVPEGLPATVTIALAIGVQRLARKNAIIRQLASVETLGSTTHICTDKTGTLTKNEMTVKRLVFDSYVAQISGVGYNPVGAVLIKTKDKDYTIGDFDSDSEDRKLRKEDLKDLQKNVTHLYEDLELISKIGVLCNNAELTVETKDAKKDYDILGDPTEGAFLPMSLKIGFNLEQFRDSYEKKYEISFESARKRMSVIHKEKESGKYFIFTKGAPDAVVEQCNRIVSGGRVIKLDGETKEKILKQNEKMAKNALRVIGFAYSEVEKKKKYDSDHDEKDLIFVGLAGMIDPPRSDVKEAVHLAKKAGIKTYIITGDHGLTAEAIGKQIDLIKDGDDHKIIKGSEIKDMSEDDLKELFKDSEKDVIFARVGPEDKLKIVSALKELNTVVAVTGDGVNDAPALKRADIGVAMGITGTDVSKEASNMVLADDSFSTIIRAVKEGRTIYENLKKFVFYIFSCNIGELITVFSGIIFALPPPLTAILILSVDIGTDVLPALALGVDPPEEGIMKRKPRDPNEKILNLPFIGRFIYVGIFTGLIVVSTYIWELYDQGWTWGEELSGDSYTYIKASTFAFAMLVLIQMVNAYNARSSYQSVFKLGFFSNLWLLGAIIISLGVAYILVDVPFFQEWVGTTALDFKEWMVIIVASFAILLVEEIRKAIYRWKYLEKES